LQQAALCIIDPIDLYMEADTQSKTGPAARGFTTPLAKMAEATGCCVLLVQHLNKAATMQALYRVKDSIDFVGAARSALCCGFDHKVETHKRRLVLPLKTNSCEEPPGQGFVISDRGLEWDHQPITVDKETMLAPPQRGTVSEHRAQAPLSLGHWTRAPLPPRQPSSCTHPPALRGAQDPAERSRSDPVVRCVRLARAAAGRRGPRAERTPHSAAGTPPAWSS
jgi:hypothetical protein